MNSNNKYVLWAFAALAVVFFLGFFNKNDTSAPQTQQAEMRASPQANNSGNTQQVAPSSFATQCGVAPGNYTYTAEQSACISAKNLEALARLKSAELQQSQGSFLGSLFSMLLPFALIFAFYYYFIIRRQNGGGGGTGGVGKSKARLITPSYDSKTFADVAGAEEAKRDSMEIIDFLKNPSRYQRLGAKIPKGALLVGPPGTGKTLIAKAIAGEAGVPFFATSGSEFVEMFVGVGASRVRDMFEEARKAAPCVIFIDEIDAVGKKRGGGLSGGNDEREQTLNQLLVEMDGMSADAPPVIIIAATNRPDVLDDALKRAGRFDRQIVVNSPDFKARKALFKIHLRDKPVSHDVDVDRLAQSTTGMSGADIENVCNQAALRAASRNQPFLSQDDIESSRDKVLMGDENRSLTLSDDEKKRTALHEAGHAVIQLHHIKEGNSDPIYKATIVPRGQALGFVATLPEKDRVGITFDELKARLEIAIAGRVAEEVEYGIGKTSGGASNDYQQMTKISQMMVRELGFSDEVGVGRFAQDQGDMFGMGMGGGGMGSMSQELLQRMEAEEKKLRHEALDATKEMIVNRYNKQWLAITNALLRFETLSGSQLMKLFEDPDYDISKEFDAEQTPPEPAERLIVRSGSGIPKITQSPSNTVDSTDTPEGPEEDDGTLPPPPKPEA